ncbi:DUF924 family protein [Nitrosomonas marina]|uniref:Uncharacterized conserved protein, DUF924 family n=1 Tax=Nitrosomonas marina TaxID=917 RepID=A0A1H8GS38_9PROT|nr:DUF924 family protein [Nitrosomonas marina]SEN46862.1 Uncharacterized conserved protein, DUF924 family [Nitrosomonas marina]
MFNEVLNFWFDEIDQAMWWSAKPAFDGLIRTRFLNLHQRASQCELSNWRCHAHGRLAEIIILDQFSRNIYRNTPCAFAQDPMALVLAQEAIACNTQQTLSPVECSFLLMPYMHSESRFIHHQAKALFRTFTPDKSYTFELRHKGIIDRFGRYPHRNRILGRGSTAEEITFLKQPGSRF